MSLPPLRGRAREGGRSASAVKSDVKLNHCSLFISLDASSRHEAHADIHQGKAPARYGEMMTEAIRDLRQQHEVLAELSRRSA